MVATTRSQAKRGDKLGVSKSGSGDIKKKTWRDWMTNTVVFDKARDLWMQEIFRKENPELLGTYKFRYVAMREWGSISDTDKAPFILKALDYFAPHAVRAGAWVWKGKTARHRRESEFSYALFRFRDDYYADYFLKCPTSCKSKTWELKEGESTKWHSLTESDKAVYFAEAKKNETDLVELYQYLQTDEAYKNRHFSS